MDEILAQLLKSDLLSEESKAQLSEQFKATFDAYMVEERAKLEADVRAQLTEEFVKAREELATTVDAKVEEFLNAELDELKEDINKFRDLEVEYAEKLVEEKEALAQQLGEQLNQLVDKLDAFLEVQLQTELDELKEDIDSVKKLEFGRKIFEAVEAEFKQFRRDDLPALEQDLAEAQDRLADAEAKIIKLETERLAEARTSKMEALLEPLSGNAREQMKVILSNVATEKLDEAYKVYIGRVLKEAVTDKAKEDPKLVVVNEDKKPEGKLVTGNEEELKENQDVQPNGQLTDAQARLRKLAGLSR